MGYILGISAFYHDSGAALLKDDFIVAAAQEERFTRKKQDKRFPKLAIGYCLKEAGITLRDLDCVVFYDKPLLKFERLLETYYAFAPKGLTSFLSAIPVWIKEKMFIKRMIKEELSKLFNIPFPKHVKLFFPEHHLSHAASAFYPSPFEEAAIITVDGVGEYATTTIAHGKGKNIKILKHMDFPHSIGLLYSAFTYYTGFKVNSGEYKLMGLAPYGNPESDNAKSIIKKIKTNLIDIKDDGSIWMNMEYFNFATGLTMTNDKKWENLFGLPPREQESEINQDYMDMAFAIQTVTEEIMLKIANHAKKLTGSNNVVMAGGVALNCVSNGLILKSEIFDDLWIQPAAGDAGGALGAAFAIYYLHNKAERKIVRPDNMQGSYLGPEFSDIDIKRMMRMFSAKGEKIEDFDILTTNVAKLIHEGNVVGWFQGRMEWGPRALGNRSILGDARSSEMQKKLNLKIKYRESFRPFAPSVMMETSPEFFDMEHSSPYMLLVTDVVESRRNPLPENYYTLPLKEKLYHIRSDVPAITHLNYSARIQTVHKETNPRYWHLINKFKELTGYGIIVNTSFNVRGEPIVCTPEDAYRCFMRTEMDYLVVNNYLFKKEEQPEFNEEKDWRDEFVLD